jgi:POT family proton-dependent oligopeptide transporter
MLYIPYLLRATGSPIPPAVLDFVNQHHIPLLQTVLPLLDSELHAFHGPHVAFGVPGILMFIATVVFWLGRKKLVHVPPARQVNKAFDWESIKALINLLPIFAVIAVFWSLYDQCSSSWVQQAEHMDLHFLNILWTADQFQVLNPVLVLIFVPLFSFVIYPVAGKFVTLTPLRKMSVGFFFITASFLVPAWVETQIGAGLKPTIAWQILAYAFLMISEVMVYATGLEFTYAQAPKQMKSMVMALFLATNTVGNLFTSAVNFFIQNSEETVKRTGQVTKLTGANYYLFFAGLMFVASVAFIIIAIFYRGKTFIQDEEEVQPTPA